MSEEGVLRLSKKRQEVPVELTAEDGVIEKYVIREMSGKSRELYLEEQKDRMKFGPGGKMVGLKSFKGLSTSLLVRCMFNESDELVKAADLLDLPSTTLEALGEKAAEINGLNKKGEEEIKND